MHIYCLTNLLNGKMYVGKSHKNFGVRESHHFKLAMTGSTSCPALYNAIRKYGPESFSVSTLCVPIKQDSEILKDLEISIIAQNGTIKHGYNISPGGLGSTGPHSEEWKKNMSERMSGPKNHFFGKKHTVESMARAAQKHHEKIHTISSNEKRSKSLKGRRQDPEFVVRRIACLKAAGWKPSKALRALWSKQRTGRVVSEITRGRMREAAARRKAGATC